MNSVTETTSEIKPAVVRYDKSARQYVIELRLPAGAENKTRAEWMALSFVNPQVADAARDLIALGHDEQRALRAGQIVTEGRVLEHYRDGDYSRALVKASEGNRSPVSGLDTYFVTHNLIWKCDCQDYERARANGERGHRCKHIQAVVILESLADEAQAAAERRAADRAERRASLPIMQALA